MNKTAGAKGKERGSVVSTRPEKRNKTMEKEATHEESDMLANNPEQPSWVAALQASIEASLNDMQVKIDARQQNMDAKLDKLGERIEENLNGVREEVGQLKEEMEKLGTEMKQELESFREGTRGRFEAVDAELRDQRKDIEILEERTGEAEEWNTEAHDIITASLEQQVRLQEKLTDLEGRSRRNNIRIWGVREGLEGDSVTEYINKLIHKELGMAEDIKLDIQRAHRALAPKPLQNKPPRAIIVNFLRFDVKENILKTAWRTQVEVDGQRVNFDHDYPTEVAAKRRNYRDLKKILKEKGIRFQSPMTTLRIHWNDGSRVYASAQEAARAMRQRGLTVPVQGEERPTLLQRMEAARKWSRVGRRQREDIPGQRAMGELNRFKRSEVGRSEDHGGKTVGESNNTRREGRKL